MVITVIQLGLMLTPFPLENPLWIFLNLDWRFFLNFKSYPVYICVCVCVLVFSLASTILQVPRSRPPSHGMLPSVIQPMNSLAMSLICCFYVCSVMSDSATSRTISSAGYSLHRVSQARILEWVAIFYSRGSSWPRDQTHISLISCIGKWILYHFTTWETLLT